MTIKREKLSKKKSLIITKSRIFWIIVSILFAWFILIRPEYNISMLRKEGEETKGLIYRKSSVGSKGTVRCFYKFEVQGKIYEGFYDNEALNQWDSLQIVYYKKDPNLNQAKQFVLDY